MKVISRKELIKASELSGYSVPGLAAEVGITPTHLYSILRGESTQPKTAAKIAKAVKRKIPELFATNEDAEEKAQKEED